MTGFVWRKNNIIDYERYNEYWYGEEASIIGKIMPQLQTSRKFIEHRLVDIVRFVIDLIRLALAIYAGVDFIDIIDQTDGVTHPIQIVIFFIALISILALPVIQSIAACRLKRKLKKLLEQINSEWNSKGIKISFPKHIKKFNNYKDAREYCNSIIEIAQDADDECFNRICKIVDTIINQYEKKDNDPA